MSDRDDSHGEIPKRLTFSIVSAGGMPEREHTYHYTDYKYDFYFYIEPRYEGDDIKIRVKDATTQLFHGMNPQIHPSDLDGIKMNIEKFFATNDFFTKKPPIANGGMLLSISFDWSI